MRWMKAREAARYCAGISLKLLYKAARENKLRVAYIGSGRNWLTCAAWLDDWLTTSGSAPSKAAVDQEARS